jgi:DNA-binding response OmpR family regulator
LVQRQKLLLLVFTADEPFWQKLVRAASAAAHKLVRKRSTGDSKRAVNELNPGAVLLDLDPPSAWDTADSLLQDGNAPPLLLLTSRRGQIDFKSAIEAGSLIDKNSDPDRVLALAEEALQPPGQIIRERSAMQRLVIRWLKPCRWWAPGASRNRFWGIKD